MNRRRAVFLDRDGVINRAVVRDGRPYPPATLGELEILPGVAESMRLLSNEGWLLIVVTNQPDVARGTTSAASVENIHRFLIQTLPIDEIRACYHDDDEGCICRKPSPGALLSAAAEHGISLTESFMVGDRWRDTEAGRRAGCKVIFIDYGYNEKRPTDFNYRADSLRQAAEIILESRNENGK